MDVHRKQFPISPALLSLSVEEVRRLDEEVTGGEGFEYYTGGFIRKAAVFLNKISGRVREAYGEYLVEVTVDDVRLSTSCTCEARSGMCKHVIALLYSWVFDQDSFHDVGESLLELRALDKDELIEIIGRMIQYDPRNADFFEENPDAERELDEPGYEDIEDWTQ
ncbi:MAG: SWIM zinc finger family protein [candidate division KSB1 bacterium]|nr:SWIM zinc finger family protein [candidate division KSB1 bacterium]